MRVKVKQRFRELIDDERAFEGIEAGEEYVVFGVSSENYRIWDRDGLPVLYPKLFFEVTDAVVPRGWVFLELEEDDYRLQPADVSSPGFYEDLFGSGRGVAAQANARAVVRRELLRLQKSLGDSDQVLVQAALDRAGLAKP